MQLTLIKKAKDQNSNTTLSIFRSNEFSPVFFVDLQIAGKLHGRSAFNSYDEALDKFYDLIEAGIKFNNYDFKPMLISESEATQ